MIQQYEKFRFVDEHKRHEFYAEVNWDTKDPLSNKCQLVKFTFPNGETAIIARKYLNSFLFAIGTENDQKNLMPVKLSKITTYETIFGIKATKDIRKGEMINVPVKFDLPGPSEEVIGNIKKYTKPRYA